MKVLVAEKCGFCPGVRTAINLAKKTLENQKIVYSLGPIIHNEDVVRQLAGSGLHTVSGIGDIPEGTVLIRSHGATSAELDEIKHKGLDIVDATCVLVTDPAIKKLNIALRAGDQCTAHDIAMTYESVGPAELVAMLDSKELPRDPGFYEAGTRLLSDIIRSAGL